MEKRNIIDGKEVAYIVAPSEDLKGWQPVLVVKDEPGFRRLPDYPPGSSKERAESLAHRLNERVGVSKEEALHIAVTTMRNGVDGGEKTS